MMIISEKEAVINNDNQLDLIQLDVIFCDFAAARAVEFIPYVLSRNSPKLSTFQPPPYLRFDHSS